MDEPNTPSMAIKAALALAIGAAARMAWSAVGRQSPASAAMEPGRGRQADMPHHIPLLGWRDILWRTYSEIQEDRILSIAGGMTFYTLLALFPAIAASIAIYGLFNDPATINAHFEQAKAVLPYGAADIIGDQLKAVSVKPDSTLSLTFAGGLLVSLWSASSAMRALIDALNVAYGEKEKRSFVAVVALSLLFTVLGVLFLVIALGAVVVLPIVLAYLPLGPAAEWAASVGRWIIMWLLLMGGLAALYRYGPSRREPKWRWVSVGSVAASLAWILASAGLSIYAAHFANYDKTYGSLGAVIGFMFWMWISGVVVLAGAELNAEIEHQTAKDSTVGSPKPLGLRGATMADTVGKAVP